MVSIPQKANGPPLSKVIQLARQRAKERGKERRSLSSAQEGQGDRVTPAQPSPQLSEQEQLRLGYVREYGERIGNLYYKIYITEKRFNETQDPQEKTSLGMSLAFYRRDLRAINKAGDERVRATAGRLPSEIKQPNPGELIPQGSVASGKPSTPSAILAQQKMNELTQPKQRTITYVNERPQNKPTQAPDFIQQGLSFAETGRLASERLARTNVPAGFVGSFASGVVQGAAGIAYLASRPKETAAGVTGLASEFIANPISTTQKVAGEQYGAFMRNPAAYAGSFAIQTAVFRGAGEAISPGTRFVGTKAAKIRARIDPGYFPEPKSLPYTPTESLYSLQRVEGQTVPTIMANPGNFPIGGIKGRLIQTIGGKQRVELIAKPKFAGDYRSAYEQYSFYRSTPDPITGEVRAFTQYTQSLGPLREGKASYSIFSKTPQYLFEEVYVTPTRAKPGTNIVKVLAEQERQPGRSFIGAENVAGISKESQITTPTKVTSFPRTGRPPSPGSTVELVSQGFTYYTAKLPAPSWLPRFIRESDAFIQKTKVDVRTIRTLPEPPSQAMKYGEPVQSGRVFTRTYSSSGATRNVSLERAVFRPVAPPVVSSSATTTGSGRSVPYVRTSPSVSRNNSTFNPPSISSLSDTTSPPPRSGSSQNYPSPSPPRYNPPRETTSPPRGSNSFASINQPRKNSITRRSVPSVPRLPPYSPPRTPPNRPRYTPRYDTKKDTLVPAFEVQYRTRGEIRTAPGLYSREGGTAYGINLLRNTLRASYRLKPTGSFVKQGPTIAAPKIPLYTTPKGWYVQPRGTRLGTQGEIREIQSARARVDPFIKKVAKSARRKIRWIK